MVDRGMDADVVGDKGRYSLKRVMSGTGGSDMTAINRIGQEAMWAVSLIKELWRKSIWNDAKTVSIVSRATRHPNVKVQSAAIHFFLGNEDDDGLDSDDEQEDDVPSIKKLNHQNLIKKKTKAGERAFSKAKVTANKVSYAFQIIVSRILSFFIETEREAGQFRQQDKFPGPRVVERSPAIRRGHVRELVQTW